MRDKSTKTYAARVPFILEKHIERFISDGLYMSKSDFLRDSIRIRAEELLIIYYSNLDDDKKVSL